MDAQLELRRRVLVVTFRKYLDAERAWNAAMRDARTWFPAGRLPSRSTIGDPGSPIRRLYERRERAVLQLAAARLKLETARQRLEARRRAAGGRRVLLLGVTRG